MVFLGLGFEGPQGLGCRLGHFERFGGEGTDLCSAILVSSSLVGLMLTVACNDDLIAIDRSVPISMYVLVHGLGGFRVSGFQGFRVYGFQCFRVSGFRGVQGFMSQGLKVSMFQGLSSSV